MTDARLLAQARQLRAGADRLLHEDGLLAAVAAAGPAAVIGSHALELVTWPDVGVSVELRHEQDVAAFFDAGRASATGFALTRMSVSNHFPRTDRPFDLRCLPVDRQALQQPAAQVGE